MPAIMTFDVKTLCVPGYGPLQKVGTVSTVADDLIGDIEFNHRILEARHTVVDHPAMMYRVVQYPYYNKWMSDGHSVLQLVDMRKDVL